MPENELLGYTLCMSKIHILPQRIVNKIAAGEVIERPASVVKELLENAIDAGSRKIRVSIEKGGVKLIEVSDDGIGMSKEDAKLVLLQHATSKLSNDEDLVNISTLGFRGEALASIAAVSDITIHTLANKSRPTLISNTKNKISIRSGEGRSHGTTVKVSNIFGNIPARRKFLRSEQTETKYISEIFINLTLAHPEIGFEFYKNGRKLFDLPASNTLSERISQIFPQETTANLIEIKSEQPGISIGGLIGHPQIARSDNSVQLILLNKRPIKDPLISKAVRNGFETSLFKGQYPIFFLDLVMDPRLFDVNVHPRKLEVRFLEPGHVFSFVRNTINRTLEKHLHKELTSRFSENQVNIQHVPQFSRIKPGTSRETRTEHESMPRFNFQMGAMGISETQNSDTNFGPDMSEYVYKQIFETYIVFEKEGKLFVIDQHAADERVNFEKIQKRTQGIESEDLLVPEKLDLTPKEYDLCLEYDSELGELGFKIDNLSKKSLQLTTIPAILRTKKPVRTLKLILSELESTAGDSKASWKKASDKIIATLACHASIRAGRGLSQSEMRQLVSNLFECDLPYSCPHGRPIVWELSKYEIERKFKRKK